MCPVKLWTELDSQKNDELWKDWQMSAHMNVVSNALYVYMYIKEIV